MILTPRPRRIEGYAIVSEEGMLAKAARIMPNSLKFQIDRHFRTWAGRGRCGGTWAPLS